MVLSVLDPGHGTKCQSNSRHIHILEAVTVQGIYTRVVFTAILLHTTKTKNICRFLFRTLRAGTKDNKFNYTYNYTSILLSLENRKFTQQRKSLVQESVCICIKTKESVRG